MSALTAQHVLTGNELNASDINHIVALALKMKHDPLLYKDTLQYKSIALVFAKPSLRTRFSFTTAIHQLGAHVIESVSETRKYEEPKDVIRVIQGYCDAMMIRTFDDAGLAAMQAYAKIPIINGLTDLYHPCQTLADLVTLKERFGSFDKLKVAYIGDGNNILHSLLLMATKIGITVQYCCPKGHAPNDVVLDMIENTALVESFAYPKEAVSQCHGVYTDVWTSMGFAQKAEADFAGYQVDEALMSLAHKDAVFMHCMPMERGKEVSDTLPDAPCSVVFQQSENRLYAQKALLLALLHEGEIA